MQDNARRRSQFTDDERRRILAAAGSATVRTVCREFGICFSTFYRWRARLAQPIRQEGIRLHDLESENRRLKNQVAELWLDYTSLRNALLNGMEREC